MITEWYDEAGRTTKTQVGDLAPQRLEYGSGHLDELISGTSYALDGPDNEVIQDAHYDYSYNAAGRSETLGCGDRYCCCSLQSKSSTQYPPLPVNSRRSRNPMAADGSTKSFGTQRLTRHIP